VSQIVIQARDLHFAYGERRVLQSIDLAVHAGQILGLVGADGAGKTTLLRILIGQLPVGEGEASVLDQPPATPALRDDLAYMPQGFGLYQDLSVQENLEFFADLHGLASVQARTRISDLLARTGLKGFENRRAGNLSGGMMQKLALACALVSQPRVMFLDEPTTGVDPVSRRAFWDLLEGVRAEGVAILYATANMDEAERCDEVALLQEGRLQRQGTPLDLVQTDTTVLLGVSGSGARKRRRAIAALPGVQLVFPVGRRLNVWLEAGFSPEDFRSALNDAAPDLQSEPLHPTLHDAALRDLALASVRYATDVRHPSEH
jgi:ABC-2 type transport system ATP-binding protein